MIGPGYSALEKRNRRDLVCVWKGKKKKKEDIPNEGGMMDSNEEKRKKE